MGNNNLKQVKFLINGRWLRNLVILILFILIFEESCYSQIENNFLPPAQELNYPRLRGALIVEGVVYFASMAGLYELWYKKYPKSSFHFFNDNEEWLQMDKAGHFFTSYTIGLVAMQAFRWAGVSERKAMWYGGSMGLAFQTSIEIMDGFSEQWGFSSGDMAANILGSALLVTQQLAWKQQRILPLISYHPTSYSAQRPDVFGSNFIQNILKDYNGQTYWLSSNIHSFLNSKSKFPSWINVTAGYGADGMLSGRNTVYKNLFDTQLVVRSRKFFFCFDSDFSRFKLVPLGEREYFLPFEYLKIPSPVVEHKNHKLKAIPLYF